MAFENIDTKQLMDVLTQCKMSLDHSKIENINNGFKSNSVWVSKSKENLTSSIDKLINTRYKPLEAQINNYIEVTKLIDKYKQLEEELKRDISSKPQLTGNISEDLKNQALKMKESSDRLKNAVFSTKDFSIKNIMDVTRTELETSIKAVTQVQAEKKRTMEELLTKIETLMNK